MQQRREDGPQYVFISRSCLSSDMQLGVSTDQRICTVRSIETPVLLQSKLLQQSRECLVASRKDCTRAGLLAPHPPQPDLCCSQHRQIDLRYPQP